MGSDRLPVGTVINNFLFDVPDRYTCALASDNNDPLQQINKSVHNIFITILGKNHIHMCFLLAYVFVMFEKQPETFFYSQK